MNEISCSSLLENRNTSHILTVLPPPPAKNHRGSLSAVSKQNSLGVENEVPSQQPSIPLPSLVLPSVPPKTSESISSSPTESATSPRSSVSLSTDKSWSFFKDGSSGWMNFEEHHHLLGNDEDNSERHSSDDDFDIWSINAEQKDYYVNQFQSMQPDLQKKITGATAKEFFEKSKLPLIELSKIWQLSDVDKDGALSVEEFCTAMHLVVLRRNNIELPDLLPPSLVPKMSMMMCTEEKEGVLVSTNHASGQIVSSPEQASPAAEVVSPRGGKEWTKFSDSPTSSLSSPGMKPVNFDFSAASVEQDPKILHPVALRLSPERQASYPVDPEREQSGTHPSTCTAHSSSDGKSEAIIVRVHSSSFSGTSEASTSKSGPKKEPPPPPPPRPKHHHMRSSSLDLNKLGKTVPHFLGAPPAVPPRVSPSTGTPQKSNVHTDEHNLTDSIDFADFTNFDEADVANLQLKSGAFEVYKKPSQDRLLSNPSAGSETFLLEEQIVLNPIPVDDSTALLVDIHDQQGEVPTERTRHPSAPLPPAIAAATITQLPRDKRELQAAIKAHRERNMMLTLLNNELNQELSEIMEERIALEIQLEHLKPFS